MSTNVPMTVPRLQLACNVSAMCLQCAFNVPAMCLQYASNVPVMCLRGAWDVPTTCLQCTCDVPAMCLQCVYEVSTTTTTTTATMKTTTITVLRDSKLYKNQLLVLHPIIVVSMCSLTKANPAKKGLRLIPKSNKNSFSPKLFRQGEDQLSKVYITQWKS